MNEKLNYYSCINTLLRWERRTDVWHVINSEYVRMFGCVRWTLLLESPISFSCQAEEDFLSRVCPSVKVGRVLNNYSSLATDNQVSATLCVHIECVWW